MDHGAQTKTTAAPVTHHRETGALPFIPTENPNTKLPSPPPGSVAIHLIMADGDHDAAFEIALALMDRAKSAIRTDQIGGYPAEFAGAIRAQSKIARELLCHSEEIAAQALRISNRQHKEENALP